MHTVGHQQLKASTAVGCQSGVSVVTSSCCRQSQCLSRVLPNGPEPCR